MKCDVSEWVLFKMKLLSICVFISCVQLILFVRHSSVSHLFKVCEGYTDVDNRELAKMNGILCSHAETILTNFNYIYLKVHFGVVK